MRTLLCLSRNFTRTFCVLVSRSIIYMNKTSFVLSGTVAAIALAATAFAFVGPNSGLKTGEMVSPFHPKHIVGPLAGSENCFPCTFGNRPQVQVWINGDNDANVSGIAKTLGVAMDKYKNKEFKALVVFVTNNPSDTKLADKLKTVAKATKSEKVGMAIIGKSDSAIEDYKINTNADIKNTVLVYKNKSVTTSMVNLKADANGLKSLNAAIESINK